MQEEQYFTVDAGLHTKGTNCRIIVQFLHNKETDIYGAPRVSKVNRSRGFTPDDEGLLRKRVKGIPILEGPLLRAIELTYFWK